MSEQRTAPRLWPPLWLVAVWFLVLVVTALFYGQLPDEIPIHWDAGGQVNGTGSKAWAIPFLWALGPAIYILVGVTARIDPQRRNYAKFGSALGWVRAAISLFPMALLLATVAIALGYQIDMGKIVIAVISALFIVIGNFMGKLRFNYFMGIRTPWTLADERVWNQTHRLGGVVWVIGGVVGLLSALAGGTVGSILFLGVVAVMVVVPLAASYVYYRRVQS